MASWLTALFSRVGARGWPMALAKSMRRRTQVLTSGYFDADWYLETYPDTAHSGVDPLTHYLKNGAFEGRNPSPGFDGEAYFQANPHLRGMGISPLEHFLRQIELSADIARKDGDGSRG